MSERFLKQLLTAAWMGVALGLAVWLARLAAAAGFGGAPAGSLLLADLVHAIVMGALVCAGLAIGLSAGRRRMELMGLLGFISGPAASLVAGLLRGAVFPAALGSTAGLSSPTPAQCAILRAIEFGLLGAVVGIISRRPWGTRRTHAAVGLAFGLVYGGVVLLIAVQGSRTLPSARDLTVAGVGEVLLPLGCSLILHAAGTLGPRSNTGPTDAQPLE